MRTVLLLFLALSAPAWPQLRFFDRSIGFPEKMPPPRRAVTADVTATLTARTPWGAFVHTETGKYWRSRNGMVRQDTAHGISRLSTFGNPRSVSIVDHRQRQVWVDLEMEAPTAAQSPFDGPRVTYGNRNVLDATGEDFYLTVANGKPEPKFKKSGRTNVDGLKVTIRQAEWQGQKYEIWTVDELKMIVQFKVTSESAEFVQRYSNIRQTEPPASVFEMPVGYRMVKEHVDQTPQNRRCHRQDLSISGQPGILETARLCASP